ncbi:MAG: hypothetical protein Kow00106_06230 [Anaerolineae bacterium]
MASILIVDDSGLSRRILRRILESGGHTVTEATDGMSALEQYVLTKPQVVLLDLTMSDMHGLEVLARLRDLDPHARIIVATADVQRSTQEMAMQAGASGFLSKPFEEQTVLAAVAGVLGGGA